MRIFTLLLTSFILSACTNVNSKAIEYREVHVESKKNPLLIGDNANHIDVSQGEKIIRIDDKKKFDIFYDKPVG